METFRCPACLFVLADAEQSRCPSCHKRFRRRGRPIVLGDKTKFATHEPLHIDLVYAEHAEREQSINKIGNKMGNKIADPVAAPLRAPVETPRPDAHATIFAPSQFDPVMRQVLDDLYLRARAEVDDEVSEGGERA